MEKSNNSNGNSHINSSRESVNNRIKNLHGLGSTKGRVWKIKLKNRSI